MTGALTNYDRACATLAEAKRVDEVKDILDAAAAMQAYARQAKNRDLEADAVELRMRATRRLDELRRAQAETVGLNQGAAPREDRVEIQPGSWTRARRSHRRASTRFSRTKGGCSAGCPKSQKCPYLLR